MMNTQKQAQMTTTQKQAQMTTTQKQALLVKSVTQRSLCRVMGWNYSHFNKVISGKTPCGRKKANLYASIIGGSEADWLCGGIDKKEELWRNFVSGLTS